MGDADLRDENETLREEVRQLRELLAPCWHAPPILALNHTQETMMRVLLGHKIATHAMLYNALYGDRLDPPESNIMTVNIHHLRQRLRRIGIEVHNVFGVGFRLSPEDRARLQEDG